MVIVNLHYLLWSSHLLIVHFHIEIDFPVLDGALDLATCCEVFFFFFSREKILLSFATFVFRGLPGLLVFVRLPGCCF